MSHFFRDVFVAEDEERIFGGILGTLGGGLVGGAVGTLLDALKRKYWHDSRLCHRVWVSIKY